MLLTKPNTHLSLFIYFQKQCSLKGLQTWTKLLDHLALKISPKNIKIIFSISFSFASSKLSLGQFMKLLSQVWSYGITFLQSVPQHRSHIIQYCCGYCKLEYLQGHSSATATGAAMHAVATEHPRSTLNVTSACRNHSGTASRGATLLFTITNQNTI